MPQSSRQRRLPPVLPPLLYLLALLTLAAGALARLRLPGIGVRLGQQYDALVQELGMLGGFMPPLAGALVKVATTAGVALFMLALLFSLLLFACGRLASRWAGLQRRVERLEQLMGELSEREGAIRSAQALTTDRTASLPKSSETLEG